VYLMGVVIVEGKGQFLGVNLGRFIIINGDCDALFPNYFVGGLVVIHIRLTISIRRLRLDSFCMVAGVTHCNHFM